MYALRLEGKKQVSVLSTLKQMCGISTKLRYAKLIWHFRVHC